MNKISNKKTDSRLKKYIEDQMNDTKKAVVNKIMEGNCLILGDAGDILSFGQFLSRHGVNVDNDISFLEVGADRQNTRPMEILSIDKITKEQNRLIIAMIKKNDTFLKFVSLKMKILFNRDDPERLIMIRLVHGQGVEATLLSKDKKLTKKNILDELKFLFDTKNTIDYNIEIKMKEKDNIERMYG